MTKPTDFSTKPKHLKDRGKKRESFYTYDPTPFLSSVATGMPLAHSRFGICTTGYIPDGLTAYTREYDKLVPCTAILFIWRDKRHFPVTQSYIHNALLPYSVKPSGMI